MPVSVKNRERKLTPLVVLNYVKTSGIFPAVCFLIALLVNALLVFVIPVEKWLQEFDMVGMLTLVGQYIPSIRKIGELSEYPLLFQFVFLIEVILISMLVIPFIKYGNFKLEKALKERMSAALIILVGLVGLPFYILVYMPGDPEGVGYLGSMTRSILYSKIGFVWWTSFMSFLTTIFLSFSAALTYKWISR